MRHMGKSGKTAIGASLAALALLVLAGATLNETVALWFLAASAIAYVACVAEVVIRRRHKTLLASGVGSILFIGFGIAFLRQWGLAFNAAPDALSAPVDSTYPDLYFYLSAAAGAATLLLLLAGTVLPGRGPAPRAGYASRRPAAASRRPVPRKPPARPASRPAASRTSRTSRFGNRGFRTARFGNRGFREARRRSADSRFPDDDGADAGTRGQADLVVVGCKSVSESAGETRRERSTGPALCQGSHPALIAAGGSGCRQRIGRDATGGWAGVPAS